MQFFYNKYTYKLIDNQINFYINYGHLKLIYIFTKIHVMERNELYLNVTRILRAKRMQQKDLAEKMGVAPAALSKALTGNPTLDTIRKIAKALDVSIKSLFEDNKSIEGFISINGKYYRINSHKELLTLLSKANYLSE